MMNNTQNTLPVLAQSDTTEAKLYAPIIISDNIQETKITASMHNLTPSTDSIIYDDHIPLFTKFVNKLSKIDEDTLFTQNGYKKMNKICDTLQGQLFKAQKIINKENKITSSSSYVAIKKTNKSLLKQKIAIEDNTNFCISENIIKEALILKYITFDNQSLGDYIIKFIDFFESDTNYYLVMEYIDGINLKQFVKIAHNLIKNGKLKLKEYKKVIKYLLWQIAVTIAWLHNDMKCCHLDLCLENIMLQNYHFIEQKDGYFMIDPNISIKMGDFGVSEVFHDSFECRKQGLSIDNELYLSPQIYSNDIYDARLADMWSLGMILYECMTGKPLYSAVEIWQSESPHFIFNGYSALQQRKLAQYLSMKNENKYFGSISFALLNNLLNIHENQRFNAFNVLKHQWFASYYKSYHKRIANKSISQKHKLLKQKSKMMQFPFYQFIKY